MNLFLSLDDIQTKTNDWLHMYIQKRPHRSLGEISPRAFHIPIGYKQ
jgi:transposase InsO family protein